MLYFSRYLKLKKLILGAWIGNFHTAYLTFFKHSYIAQIPIPNLFIIGFPKCGTTSLHAYLSQHSKVLSGKHKELAHFNYADVPWYNRKVGMKYLINYRYNFKDHTEQSYLIDATPSYIYHHYALLKIHRFNPNAKIIILFRNPLQRIISSYYQRQNNPHRTIGSRGTSLEEYIARIIDNANTDDSLGYHLYLNQYIKNVYDIFKHERIIFCLLEDFIDQPQHAFSQLLNFLNLQTEPICLTDIHNQGDFDRADIKLSKSIKTKFLKTIKSDLQTITRITKKDVMRYYHA